MPWQLLLKLATLLPDKLVSQVCDFVLKILNCGTHLDLDLHLSCHVCPQCDIKNEVHSGAP
jgi:hypothetical protein